MPSTICQCTSQSPACATIAAAVLIIVIVDPTVASIDVLLPPPMIRGDPSLTSIIAAAAEDGYQDLSNGCGRPYMVDG